MVKQGWLLTLHLILLMSVFAGCSSRRPEMDAERLEETAQGFLSQLEALEETAEYLAAATESILPTPPPIPTFEPTTTKRPTLHYTNTPAVTDTATVTPSPTARGQAYLSGDTNCRTGPSKSYDWLTLVEAGETINILGRDKDDQYWVIENPADTGVCWLWKQYATPVGTIGGLPIFPSPPTKTPTKTPSNTPAPRFLIKLEQVILCDGQESMVIRVYNSFNLPYQSWRAHIFNLPSNLTQTAVGSNYFSHHMDECTQTIANLPSRRTGYAIVPFDSLQAQEFLVEFEACTEPGKGGDCAFDGFKFNVQFLTATPTNTATSTVTPTPTKTPTITPSNTPVP